MADLSDVLVKLEDLITQAVYPNGIDQPSVAGVGVVIEQGWPIRSKLDISLTMGNAHVSVFPTNKERVVTKFERVFIPIQKTPATISATVLGQTVTIGGVVTIPPAQAVMVIVNNIGYAYQVLESDTLNSIASSLANIIPSATAVESVITIPIAKKLIARITTPYSAGQELGRQERVFMITVWAPNPTIRTLLGSAIDVFFRLNYRIVLSDDYFAQVFYSGVRDTDILQKSKIYRRDLDYNIQYATTRVEEFTTITDSFAQTELVYDIEES